MRNKIFVESAGKSAAPGSGLEKFSERISSLPPTQTLIKRELFSLLLRLLLLLVSCLNHWTRYYRLLVPLSVAKLSGLIKRELGGKIESRLRQ